MRAVASHVVEELTTTTRYWYGGRKANVRVECLGTTRAERDEIGTLKAAGVQFLRYTAIGASNTPRAKAVPIDRLLADPRQFYGGGLSIAEVCFGGLPSYADHLVPESNLSSAILW